MNKNILMGKNICKQYGKQEVLKNLDITIKSGCIYGLIGRNGVGKTTLLGILTGQNKANSGEITLDGEQVWENKKALSQICFSRELQKATQAFQTGYKVNAYLKMAEMYYPNWDKEYAKKLVAHFKLDEKKHIYKISKGQSSMVSIIVALASRSPITILDEPTAGLDIVARDNFYKLLLKDFEENQRTFILSTHIIDEASSIFERVLILDDGKIIEDKDTLELVGEFRTLATSEDISAIIGNNQVEILNEKTFGKHKIYTLRASEDVFARLEENGAELEEISLQNTFLALCGNDEEVL